MDIVAKRGGMGKGTWIILMILGFVVFWPVGLAILAYLVMSGRMHFNHYGRNHHMREEWLAQKRNWAEHMAKRCMQRANATRTSGNAAFDAYKDETLRRLEEEQSEFTDFLDRLRKSKDKAEFDQFMADRRRNSSSNANERGDTKSTDDGRDAPTIDY